jgi:hypothetical protein
VEDESTPYLLYYSRDSTPERVGFQRFPDHARFARVYVGLFHPERPEASTFGKMREEYTARFPGTTGFDRGHTDNLITEKGVEMMITKNQIERVLRSEKPIVDEQSGLERSHDVLVRSLFAGRV